MVPGHYASYIQPQSRILRAALSRAATRSQKKLQPFDPVVERRLVALPAGYRRGIVDGRAVVMDDRTHVLIDMAVVF